MKDQYNTVVWAIFYQFGHALICLIWTYYDLHFYDYQEYSNKKTINPPTPIGTPIVAISGTKSPF